MSVGECFGQRGKIGEQLLFCLGADRTSFAPCKPGVSQFSFSNFLRHCPLPWVPSTGYLVPGTSRTLKSHNNILESLLLALNKGAEIIFKTRKKVESGEHNLGCRGNRSLI